jgi:putative methyltransferase (TIGR04325 family)
MGLKQIIKQIVPPILIDVASYLRKSNSHGERGEPPAPPEWEYMPDGWRTRDERIKGWNVESIVEAQKAKWPAFMRIVQGKGPLGVAHESPVASAGDYQAHNVLMTFAYVLALTARNRDRISLLDWGGGVGHYCAVSRALLPGVTIDYHCKDMPLLCTQGREHFPEASFYEDEAACFRRSYDLVLASGSLQFSEDWKGTVARLAAVSGSYLFITRLPTVHAAAPFVVVQRPYQYGYQTEYLCWFLNRQELVDHTTSLGMELVREFLIQAQPPVHNAPEQADYRGFLFRSRRQP